MPPSALRRTRTRPAAVSPAVLALLAGLAGALGGCAETPRTPPNAILVSIDTLRPDFLSCYGHPRPTSPALDALAARGVRFTDVTAAAPWTLPSHASMLTGLYPSRHGVKTHQTRLPSEVTTVAEELGAAGWQTLAVVNTHNVGAPQYQLGRGFERFLYVPETAEDKDLRLRTPNLGELVVGHAKELLAARDPERPFFLFLHFYDVHTDWTPSPAHRATFVGPYDGKLDGRTQQLNGVRNRGERLGDDDVRFLRELYEAEIRTFDDLFGRFLAWLGEQGLAEDTLIVVTSDHGEEFQEHGSVLHGRTQYQELLRVPLIVAGPGVPSGVVVDQPAHGVDVAPTLLAALGVDSAVAKDGLDLVPTWRGERLPERLLFAEADQDNRYTSGEHNDGKCMVRREADKLLVDLRAPRMELYDLAVDPTEQRDLARTHAALVEALGKELERFRAGARRPELIAPPTAEERRKLDAMGYGGGDDDE
jgi:arylsulfatase A-like enzyme